MNIPPIEPTPLSSTYGLRPGEEIPIRKRVHSDLFSMQQTHVQLQVALASHDSPSYIDSLLQQLHSPIQDLLQISNKQPPVLSQNEIDVVKAIQMQFQSIQTHPQFISASMIAELQGNSSTLDQMFVAEVAGIPEPNVSALQAQNYLSYLAHALHLHAKAEGMHSAASQAIINSMQKPMKELTHLSESGVLTSIQSDAVIKLTTLYSTTVQVPEKATPETITAFETNLQSLNNLLTNG
jgi:hypothetical protein